MNSLGCIWSPAIRQFRHEIFIGGDAIFDSGLLRLAEADFLEQPQQMRLALQ